MLRLLQAGGLYFSLVFAAGFALGPIRLLWLVPRFGVRYAELMEAPVMLAVIIAAARWVVRRLAVPSMFLTRLAMGTLALSLMLTAEFTLVLRLRGLSIAEYLTSRDPVSGTVYYALLGVFAVMPSLSKRRVS
ncbi:MAG: hypothetical protein HYX25_07675 [Candidatus Solibacter usitatus]|nr:hypothetical protein [Candidatus Solibacter usitatus]